MDFLLSGWTRVKIVQGKIANDKRGSSQQDGKVRKLPCNNFMSKLFPQFPHFMQISNPHFIMRSCSTCETVPQEHKKTKSKSIA